MVIDLHVHTIALSPCSRLDPEEAVRAAKSSGLDGICFTEHGRLWQAAELERLSAKWDFPIFSGMEVETREGHMLAFGLEEDEPGLLTAIELRGLLDMSGGVMIYAHPFRDFLIFGFPDLQLTVSEACERQIYKLVDAIETYSGKSTKSENELAAEVSARLALPGAGGSDAHSAGEVGRCVTIFNKNIRNTAELIGQLNRRAFRAGYFKKTGSGP
jgi:predicted metal-dependent phosphoesterase TrpH